MMEPTPVRTTLVEAFQHLTRPFVTFALVAALIATVFTNRESDALMTLTTAVVSFWFGSRGTVPPTEG